MHDLDRRTLLSFLGVASITPLLGMPEAATRHPAISHPGESRFAYATEAGAQGLPCKVSAGDSGGTFSVFEAVIPGRTGPPLHVHHREDEWFYAVAGNFAFEVGDDKFQLSAGSSALAPRRVPHRWANTDKTDGKLIFVFQPGWIETFFDDFYKLAVKGNPIDQAALSAVFAKHDLELLGSTMFPPQA